MTIVYVIAFILLSLAAIVALVVFTYQLGEDAEFNGLALTTFIACIFTISTLVCLIDYNFNERLKNNEGYAVKGTISYPVNDYGKKTKPEDTIIIDGVYFKYDTSYLKYPYSIADINENYKVEVFVIAGTFNNYIREVKNVKVVKKVTKKTDKKKSKK